MRVILISIITITIAEVQCTTPIPYGLDGCYNNVTGLTEQDKKIFSPTPPVKISEKGFCYIGCVIKKNFILNNDHKFNVTHTMNVVEHMIKVPPPPPAAKLPPPPDLDELEDVYVACNSKLKGKMDECAVTKIMYYCVKENNMPFIYGFMTI